MANRALGFVLSWWWVCAAAQAGTSFRQVITTEGGPGSGTTEMQFSVQGDALRMEFLNAPANNPMFGPGAYVLMKGTEVFLVNPEEQTYARMDLAGLGDMMSAAQQGMDAMRQAGVEMTIENQRFEKLLEEDGGVVAGYPTTHSRYRSGYTMMMKMPVGGSFGNDTDTVEDVWTSTAVELDFDPRKLASLNFGGGAMSAQVQELAKAEMEKMTGFPLKRVSVATSTPQGSGMMARMMNRGGDQGPVTTTMEVVDLTQADLPASQFEIPAGYTEVDLLSPGGQAARPAPNQSGER